MRDINKRRPREGDGPGCVSFSAALIRGTRLFNGGSWGVLYISSFKASLCPSSAGLGELKGGHCGSLGSSGREESFALETLIPLT